jgi:hypothetical protein
LLASESDGSFDGPPLLYRARASRYTCACRLAQASKEGTMTKLTLALTAALLGGFLLLKSDAAALPGLVDPPAVTKNHFSIQKAGCFLDGRYCRAGFPWVCGLPPNPERQMPLRAVLRSRERIRPACVSARQSHGGRGQPDDGS